MHVPLAERLAVAAQHLLPQHLLTAAAGRLAGARGGAATTAVIRWFIGRYGVDMAEAATPDPAAYPTFNEFFTRALRPGARPLADAELLCPVDGAISQFGAIDGDRIIQAKGRDYTTAALLAGDTALAAHFQGGHFATLYLSPRDYHRVHMPCDGRLLRMLHVPGALFSVNPATARGVDGLFARNERVVAVFDHPRLGPWALVLVGATIVGSMATVWHGTVNPPRTGALRQWDYGGQGLQLRQGDEMGRFQLGSTVVLLFAPGQGTLQWSPRWAPGAPVRMGEAMAAWDRPPRGAPD
ncbi:MAG: archaetidylserine decarboxylase [Pseudomonadota bacterium]|jgi:phosphatidylserine decarboxylase|nr:phosphatidylserine decarboxylase [Rubrivivax sp.]MCA3258371.1 phosphatidylserine decarboxylase [Rubrivivax sp.]MCE2911176.1 archaetidylserine decarboxylase [Rubrivivax sp.]MCZ8031678.1 archaetidylserine decarboxylase [Rubrivivax sp.]